MTSELNFEPLPFEFHGEAQEPSSEASGVEPEEFAQFHDSQHQGSGHHHRRHRRRHRSHRGFPSFPITALPFDDDGDDGSQPPFDDAGDFESEEEGEYRFRHGDPNFWRHHHHHSGRGNRPYWRPPSFPLDDSPPGGFNDFQPSADEGGFESEEESLIRDHRHGGVYRDHMGGAPNVWRERMWETRRAPQWRQRNFPIGSPSHWAAGRRWPWGGVGDPNRWRQWNFPKVGWPRDARVRPWWRSGAGQEPYGGWTEPDFGVTAPYSIAAMPGGTEYMHWVQGALNDVLGLRLPTHGIADAATRSAIRSFQQQKGLPVDGVVGPDTERALAAARADSSSPAGAPMPTTADMAVPPAGPPSMPDMAAAAQSPPSSPTMPASAPGTPDAGHQEFDFEWENLPTISRPVAASCAPEPGEVAASHSDAGILTKDVESTGRGILVADFGIDWRSVKERAKIELAPWIRRFETDSKIVTITICGYSDCVDPGDARYHTWLRRERARRVFNLLGPIAQRKVKVVGPAPIGTYIGANADRAARARNRSVLILFREEPGREPVPPSKPIPREDTSERFNDSIKALRSSVEAMDHPDKMFLLCIIDKVMRGGDDRVILWSDILPLHPLGFASLKMRVRDITSRAVDVQWLWNNIKTKYDVERQPTGAGGSIVTSMKKFFMVLLSPGPIGADKAVTNEFKNWRLQSTVNAILETHNSLRAWFYLDTEQGGGEAMPRDYRAILEWITEKERDPTTVLSCVTSVGRAK